MSNTANTPRPPRRAAERMGARSNAAPDKDGYPWWAYVFASIVAMVAAVLTLALVFLVVWVVAFALAHFPHH